MCGNDILEVQMATPEENKNYGKHRKKVIEAVNIAEARARKSGKIKIKRKIGGKWVTVYESKKAKFIEDKEENLD